MSFVLTEEQELIRKTAREFVQARTPVTHFRELRDSKDPVGFSKEVWAEMAELGLAGILVSEKDGGSGLGFAELGLVLEECGRALVPTPFFSTVLLGGSAVAFAGSDAQKKDILSALAAGKRILAVAHEEGTRHARYSVAAKAEHSGGAYQITGSKNLVQDGHVADQLIVSARTSGKPGDRDGISLFLVDAKSAGVNATRTSMVDYRNASKIALQQAKGELLGTEGKGADILDHVFDRAAVGLCAEMLGGLQEAFDRTVTYLKERKQFGVAIGSFQALKHRAAYLFSEVELTKSVVMEALRAIDENRSDIPKQASLAKARTSDVFLAVASEAIQMHGGIGVTDELDIGFFYKRAKVTEMTLGNSAFHRDRFAGLNSF